MTAAITRPVSPRLAECELTHRSREPLDPSRAAAQHEAYERCLAGLGVEIVRLPEEAGLPDSVFVEDTAVVLPEVAIITRPGTVSRRPETAAVARALARFRKLLFITAPATLDGGDVMIVGRTAYVGLSSRTSPSGLDQLGRILAPLGYQTAAVPVSKCLHLKSAVTPVSPDTFLINRAWVDGRMFPNTHLIDVHPTEPHAANALLIDDTVLFPAAFERTGDRLRRFGITMRRVDVSELAKAEGGVTCCSLVFEP